jgi:hypothetical protein
LPQPIVIPKVMTLSTPEDVRALVHKNCLPAILDADAAHS